ncbi:hypothetical protein F7725_019793, partial [Dissostichus mawsoni]
MGRIFLDHIGGTRLFSCANCDTILTNRTELISTRFTGATGRAFLFNKDRVMLTGRHMVRDVSCKNCNSKLGWMYEYATEESQRYKEGRIILERALVRESEGFEHVPSDNSGCVVQKRCCGAFRERGLLLLPRKKSRQMDRLLCGVALRYTRTISTGDMYYATTAVCLAEVIKLVLSLGMLTKNGKFFQTEERFNGTYILQPQRAAKAERAIRSVTYQLKIPCTALCMVLMLNRSLNRLQWFSVFMLCGGVEQNPFVGFVAIAIAVLCSGFAEGVKSSDTSLWVRNIQMYLSGIVITLIGVFLNDGNKVLENGFFFGYTHWVYFVVLLASVGGLYTSVVVKYTDNIMKGFSAAAAIVLSTVASVLLFGLHIMCVSIYLYGLPKSETMKTTRQDSDSESKQKLINQVLQDDDARWLEPAESSVCVLEEDARVSLSLQHPVP